MSGRTQGFRRRLVVESAVAAIVVAMAAMALVTLRSPDPGDGPGRLVSDRVDVPEPGGPALPCTGAMCGEDTRSDDCRGEMCGDIGSVPPCGPTCSDPTEADAAEADPTEVDPAAEPCPTADPMCGPVGGGGLGPTAGGA